MPTHALRPVNSTPAVTTTAKALHHEIRESVAVARGLQKMAQCALDEGEFPPEELDDLHALVSLHHRKLEEIKDALAELATGGRHD